MISVVCFIYAKATYLNSRKRLVVPFGVRDIVLEKPKEPFLVILIFFFVNIN